MKKKGPVISLLINLKLNFKLKKKILKHSFYGFKFGIKATKIHPLQIIFIKINYTDKPKSADLMMMHDNCVVLF